MQDVDAVIHLGGLATGGDSWADYVSTNITGTRNVFEAARRCGVARVVYASSHHVMGRHHIDVTEPIGEYEATQPTVTTRCRRLPARRWVGSTTSAAGWTWCVRASAPSGNAERPTHVVELALTR